MARKTTSRRGRADPFKDSGSPYGARLAYGCNIGAYFSGIASASVHGWLWFAAALAGSFAGTWLRPRFGLAVERTPRPTGC